jgi:hypothetical protein
MVIGENPEEQLAPYDENIDVPEYTDEDGEVTTYNPKSKWDWYELGGRWTGFLRLKPGCVGYTGQPGLGTSSAKAGYADAARLGDIDIAGMQAEAEFAMREKLSKLSGIPRDWLSWEQVKEKCGDDIDKARSLYNGQTNMEAARSALGFPWSGVDEYLATDEALIKGAKGEALQTFAVVKEGQWYERGEMGWWACISNEKEADVWAKEFDSLLSSLPPDTLISIYDCHI